MPTPARRQGYERLAAHSGGCCCVGAGCRAPRRLASRQPPPPGTLPRFQRHRDHCDRARGDGGGAADAARRDLPGTGKPALVIADMNMPEQFIIGQLYELALQQEGYTVLLNRNLGPWHQRDQALEVRHARPLSRVPGRVEQPHRAPAPPLPDAVRLVWGWRCLCTAARVDVAQADALQRHELGGGHLSSTRSRTTCTRSPSWHAATESSSGRLLEFQTIGDGLPALEHSYHLHPGYVQPIGCRLQYWWLNTGERRRRLLRDHRPELAGPSIQLSDPKHVFGFGNVVPVTTPHVLRVEGPAFRDTIEQIDALLTCGRCAG